MNCRNCGTSMDENASVCTNCGVAKGVGNNYCPNCGAFTDVKASVCVKCGVALKNNSNGKKSKLVAGLLGILLGSLGVHNFYLGYNGRAIAQLLISILSCGFLAAASAIWGLVEGIMILSGSINTDANGDPLGD